MKIVVKFFVIISGILFLTACRDNAERKSLDNYSGTLESLYLERDQEGYINDRPLIVEMTKRKIQYLVKHFCNDAGSRNYGGFVFSDDPKAYADSRGSIYEGTILFAAYLYPDFPEYFRKPEMLEMLKAHMGFMLRRQINDGSISLGTHGLGGSNEVGFTLPGIVESYKRLDESDVPGKEELMKGMKEYILNGAECIRKGFPYTSNHRWTASIGPLAAVHSIFPDERNISHIEDYLSDGIDINADGLYYEERSPNYNNVANWGLYYLIKYYGKNEFLSFINRNKNFVIDMVQPNGEAETLFSQRQDRGQAGKHWEDYWLFKYMAIKTQNGQFATVADRSLQQMMNMENGISHSFIPLIYMFDNETFKNDTITRESLPGIFTRRYEESPLWRFRNGDVASTVVVDSGGHFWDIIQSSWGGSVRSDAVMNYHVGNSVMDIFKIIWGLGTGSFRPEAIHYLEDGRIKLEYRDPGWYHTAHFRPREKWGPRHIQVDMHATMIITPHENGKMDISIKIDGYKEQPVNVHYLLRETGKLTLPGGKKIDLKEGGNFFGDQQGDYIMEAGGDAFMIKGLPESQHHQYLEAGQNITGKAENRCHRLVLGLFTPVEFQFSLIPVVK